MSRTRAFRRHHARRILRNTEKWVPSYFEDRWVRVAAKSTLGINFHPQSLPLNELRSNISFKEQLKEV